MHRNCPPDVHDSLAEHPDSAMAAAAAHRLRCEPWAAPAQTLQKLRERAESDELVRSVINQMDKERHEADTLRQQWPHASTQERVRMIFDNRIPDRNEYGYQCLLGRFSPNPWLRDMVVNDPDPEVRARGGLFWLSDAQNAAQAADPDPLVRREWTPRCVYGT